MTRQFSVEDLALKVRQRGDFEDSEHLTDAILIDFIDSAQAEVYDILVSKWEDYFTVEATFNFTAGSDAYSLPDDFYKLLGVDIKSGGYWHRLKRYNLTERNSRTSTPYLGRYKYRLQGASLKFIPEPSGTEELRITYVPVSTKLTALTDIVDGVNGWEELVVLFALKRALSREESSVTAVDNDISRQIKRLESAADARDAGESESLQDYIGTGDYLF